MALVEAVAEKFVALTRRAGAELADVGGPRYSALVRHIYDLHMVRTHCDCSDVALLAREIMVADAVAYGHQFPAYRVNPLAETLRAVEGLVADRGFADRYAAFQRDMVYGESAEFEAAITAVVALAAQVEAGSRRLGISLPIRPMGCLCAAPPAPAFHAAQSAPSSGRS